ncbi:S9 family peptidase [Kineosporia succinea]|uniref:Dipeptidyl aminopeptidase/acylaminoacyl peptidase n=1 Tax=Kineosporia succinea TaxID=84632 RepID=A0ABT9P0C1_9ACTN|nr:prolyl oligopeptidase family serine peptidase [Kineosporia succinea]MDP9826121.1 dipeptidyl aminopeptidase/acylaminoacyl peptidase [Kineosporia succinea]
MSDSPGSQLPVVPYGAWPSPISAADLVSGVTRPIDVWPGRTGTWWSQSRPDQGGREQLVFRPADGGDATSIVDLLGPDWNARSRVHEYGGAAWWVADDVVFAVSYDDQRLYRAEPGRRPVPITPTPPSKGAWRYADGRLTPDGRTVICVRETHEGDDVRNEIVALPSAPGDTTDTAPRVLVGGTDFVAAPRISPDGRHLVWIEWQHPNMPWDSTSLWIAEIVPEAGSLTLADVRLLAGAPRTGHGRPASRDGQALMQPAFGADGRLYVISDVSEWWNVYQVDENSGEFTPVLPLRSEVGSPAWRFGDSDYTIDTDGRVWLTYTDAEGANLVRVDGDSPETHPLPFGSLDSLRLSPDGSRLTAIATQATAEAVVIELRVDTKGRPAWTVLSEVTDNDLDPLGISVPRHVTFPSVGGRDAHAHLYLPASAVARGPEDARPPLIVTVHGGPTSAAGSGFRLQTQYWTSRGFAVIDVNYGGSTGYGRAYRKLLDGNWGVVDVEDACAAALWVAGQGLADASRLAIRGGSAGGYTVLASLATRDVFTAGASLYGVADLSALARDTHKFESRYLDGLVGPWPQAEKIYTERSPLTHIDGFDRPLIVLQGEEDEVVPPAQAEMIVAALASKQVPHSYLLFAGEQHGFRRAENIVRAIESELSFYGQVFGFDPAGIADPVRIRFGESLRRTR